jgi:hypothetical protein
MKKHLLLVGALLACLGTTPVMGQQAYRAIRGTNEAATRRLSLEVKQRQEANYQRALNLARKHGWVINQSFPDGSVMALKGLDELGRPMYDITDNNTRAAATTATSALWTGGSSGLNLNGSSAIMLGKLGVWDTPVRLTHQEFNGRVVQEDGPATAGDHGTHVAGTMMAAGVNPLAKGMSYGAARLRAFNFQTAESTPNMAAHAASLLVSNHSYGSIAGWRQNTAQGRPWEWWGNLDLTPANTTTPATDWKFGFYTEEAKTWDEIAYNAPYYLIVKSSGNNRTQVGPAVGQPFWRINSAGTAWEQVAARPAGISSNNGYDIISTYGNSKNILTVGAVNPIPNGYKQASDVEISTFSSWGPTDDGRIKPDIVGNGVNLLSAYSATDDAYASISGTSMSAPNVSGSLFLLQEHFAKLNQNRFMLSSTLKALVLHTADEAGNVGPDYIFGWGLMNTERAAKVISETGRGHLLEEREMAQGSTYTFQVTASGAGPLVATIAWTDPEGQVLPLTAENVNNRAPRLVNDLDVRINDGSSTHMPWILNPETPAAPATRGDNFRDNVEQVLIAHAVPGRTYTITISHKGTLQRGPQVYGLVVSGIGGTSYCTSGALYDADTRIDRVTFGSFESNTATGCTTYRDFTNRIATVEVGQRVPFSVKIGSCFGAEDAIVKAYIDWNNDGDFNDDGELVAYSGVLTKDDELTATIQVPATVKVNDVSRMRIVLVETNNASEVNACGTYSKGETQEYLVKFSNPTSDVGIAAVLDPKTLCGGNNFNQVSVLLKNFGSSAQGNIPVLLAIKDGTTTVTTLEYIFAGPLNGFSESRVSIPVSVLAIAGKTYTVEASTSLTSDANPINDKATLTVQTSGNAPAALAAAYKCGDGPVSLQGSGDGTIFWYDAAVQGNLIGAGNQITLTTPVNGNLYAAVNQFNGTIGRVYTPTAATGQNFSNNGVIFDSKVPLIIESIHMRTAGTGTISIGVTTASGFVLSSVDIDVNPNSPTAAIEGAVVPLNLLVPNAGTGYRLTVLGFTGTAGAWRDNLGATQNAGYPFTLDNVMTITGSTATDAGFYHFMYDIKVKATGCPSATRTEVSIQDAPSAIATITKEGASNFCDGGQIALTANAGDGFTYQWFRGTTAIAGATGSTYNASRVSANALTNREVNSYRVRVTNPNGCFIMSDTVMITVNPQVASVNLISTSTSQLCAGATTPVVLQALTGISSTLLTYRWSKDGEIIEGANSFSYSATLPGRYQAEVSGVTCETKTSQVFEITNADATLSVANSTVAICGNSGTAQLSATANNGNIFWYDAATGGNLVGVGNSFTTPVLTENKSYYASINEYEGTLGGASKTTGGSFTNFNNGRMYFDAEMPFILEKVTMNVSNAGTDGARTATIDLLDKDLSNAIIARRTINLTPGVNEYDVNIFIPAAGRNYTIMIVAFGGSATAYRNNTADAATYPYTIPGVVSITGNNGNPNNSFYEFMYDWKIKATGCATAQRTKLDVEVLPLATATISGTSTVCDGTEATVSIALTGIAPFTLTYTNGTTPVTVENITTNTYSFTTTQAGTFTLVSVSDAKTSCSTGSVSGTASVTVNATPARPGITANKNLTLCIGDNITLTAPAGFAGYMWSTGDTTESITVNRSGSYTVTVNNGLCNSPLSENVTVRFATKPSRPQVSVSGETTFCEGNSVVLTAPAGFATYRWSNGATTPSITVNTTGNYSVFVGNGNCESVSSDTNAIVVNATPALPIITFAGNILRSSSANGNQWMRNGVIIEGSVADTLLVSEDGIYTVRVSNTCGNAMSTETEIRATSTSTLLEARLSLYPNPVSNLLTVELVDADATNTMTAKIYNIQGIEVTTLVFEREGSLQKASVNVAQYASGVYVVKFISNSNVKTLRFVKQ